MSISDLWYDAIKWTKYGVQCFYANALLMTIFFLCIPLLDIDRIAMSFITTKIVGITCFTLIAFVLAHTTKIKILRPLYDRYLPKNIRKWSLSLSILGLFFGTIIGFLIMGYADEKIKELQKQR
ncbi:MAG: hypothetical protein DRJ60_05820 [Thermoprotei archaeon]|nr:MAG: hypothetical protein DRJ60_05820 [Thermoprotei archaeon]